MSEERLNHYKEWIEDNEEIVVDSSIFEELADEIERLNKELELYKDNHEHLNNLLQQKDNIINELFEYLKENSKQPELFESDRYYENVLDKLQEILDKEKDNE